MDREVGKWVRDGQARWTDEVWMGGKVGNPI